MTEIVNILLHIDKYLVALTAEYGTWIYAILFLVVFCETGLVVTPFLPGDSLLFAAGAVAASSQGSLNVHVLVILLWLAAVCGDVSNFEIGKHFGVKLFANPHSKIFKQEYLDKTQAFYEKYGTKTIVLARFVPIVRTFAPFVAGMGKMHYGRFFHYNVIGGAVWTFSLTYLGYAFGNMDSVKNNFSKVVLGIIVVSILPMLIEFIRAKRAK